MVTLDVKDRAWDEGVDHRITMSWKGIPIPVDDAIMDGLYGGYFECLLLEQSIQFIWIRSDVQADPSSCHTARWWPRETLTSDIRVGNTEGEKEGGGGEEEWNGGIELGWDTGELQTIPGGSTLPWWNQIIQQQHLPWEVDINRISSLLSLHNFLQSVHRNELV